MDKPHCDRCDVVIEVYPTWVEVAGIWADMGSPHIVHFNFINAHSHRLPPAFCQSCAVRILRQYCDEQVPPVVVAEPEVVQASAKRMIVKHGASLDKLADKRVKKKKLRASITRGTR